MHGRFKSKTGRIVSDETKEKIRQANLGKKCSPETIEKRASKRRGKPTWNSGIKTGPQSQERRSAISKALKGKIRSPEHCKKLSESKKGSTPWNKGKTGGTNGQKGVAKPHQTGDANPAKRPEVREKIAQAKKVYWAKRKAGIAPA